MRPEPLVDSRVITLALCTLCDTISQRYPCSKHNIVTPVVWSFAMRSYLPHTYHLDKNAVVHLTEDISKFARMYLVFLRYRNDRLPLLEIACNKMKYVPQLCTYMRPTAITCCYFYMLWVQIYRTFWTANSLFIIELVLTCMDQVPVLAILR